MKRYKNLEKEIHYKIWLEFRHIMLGDSKEFNKFLVSKFPGKTDLPYKPNEFFPVPEEWFAKYFQHKYGYESDGTTNGNGGGSEIRNLKDRMQKEGLKFLTIYKNPHTKYDKSPFGWYLADTHAKLNQVYKKKLVEVYKELAKLHDIERDFKRLYGHAPDRSEKIPKENKTYYQVIKEIIFNL
jgi:hypothetical protein